MALTLSARRAAQATETTERPLTSIVVGKGLGTPGLDIPIDAMTLNSSREKVYTHDWYDEHPPTEAELAAAMKAGMGPAAFVKAPAKRLKSARQVLWPSVSDRHWKRRLTSRVSAAAQERLPSVGASFRYPA